MPSPLQPSVSQLILPGGKNIEFSLGDITDEQTDAIVNAANSALVPGSGVSGAIHRGGGPAIYQECRKILRERGELRDGEAVMTTGGKLPARYVIHAVGPVWRGGSDQEPERLRSCYRESMELADRRGLKSIAFPAISTGVFGYPIEPAAEIAVSEVVNVLQGTKQLNDVHFVLFDPATFAGFVAKAKAFGAELKLKFETYTAE
jgi:O-acetyl-ADP-ribose deacetylase (regulator of RNase III)